MLKFLLKKQFMEIFRGFIINRKTNKPRSKANCILMFVLYGFLLIGVIGGSFSAIAVGVCSGLAPVGMGWLYFILFCGIAILLGTLGSAFNSYSGLYLPKDNDLLLSMPIPVKTIIASRLLNVFLLGAMYSSVVMLPTLIVYWVFAGITAASVICGILLFLDITLLVMMLSCLLGWVVAKVSLKLKNKSFVIVLLAVVFIGLYYFVNFKAQEWIRGLVANAAVYGANIKGSAYALYLFGRIGEGDILATAIFTAATVLLLALTLFILSRGFLKLATSTGSVSKTRYQEKRASQRSVFSALLSKEFSRFTSSPNYMLNTGLGILLIPVFGVFLLIKGPEMMDTFSIVMNGRTDTVELILCAVIMMVCAMNDMAAPSVSLEGKSVWIPQTLPVDAKTVLKAKAAMHLILSSIPMLIVIVCEMIVLNTPVADKLMICLIQVILTVFFSVFASFAGIKNPIMDWTTEIIPIKQSGAVMLTLFGGWGIAVVFAAPYFLVGQMIGLIPYLAVWSVIFAVVTVLMYRWLMTKGAEAFSNL